MNHHAKSIDMKLLFACLVSFLPQLADAQTIVFNLGLDSLNLPCIIQTTFTNKSGDDGSWTATAGQHVDRFNTYPEALAAARMLKSKMVSDSVAIQMTLDANTRHLKQMNSIIQELERLCDPPDSNTRKMRNMIVPGSTKMK